VYELSFHKLSIVKTVYQLLQILFSHGIDVVNTHSSMDAWIGGIAARLGRKKIVRTRHLSTPIRKGLNSRLLYKGLADYVVTTSSSCLSLIEAQSSLPASRLQCIPTGIDLNVVKADSNEVSRFRTLLGLKEGEFLVGTACFLRSWKGIVDLLKAAQLLKERKEIKWIIVGGGHVNDYRPYVIEMGLEESVIFTGHLENPYPAIAAMDLFMLLSTAHEGISQATLQAAYLERPLVTTPVGGLPEVCLHGKTGLVVPAYSPDKVAEAVLMLLGDEEKRRLFGKNGKQLIEERFTLEHTLNGMEKVCELIAR
jgi:glycosyltransferase involved in cell wall biosynthesis